MKRLLGLSLCVFMMIACSSTAPKDTVTEKTFFDASIVDSFIPGKTTQDDIRKALGEPYPDPLKTPQRWTYMYTFQRQVIFIFKDGVMTEKTWSEQYGIGTGGK